ncbi:MAG: hypothetical protein DRI57_21625 [Deltaproteobacteria bacterium]|nr:MAG: hypothetical protein DRI57_21625 [Deltaproteobacteria bacterium]
MLQGATKWNPPYYADAFWIPGILFWKIPYSLFLIIVVRFLFCVRDKNGIAIGKPVCDIFIS